MTKKFAREHAGARNRKTEAAIRSLAERGLEWTHPPLPRLRLIRSTTARPNGGLFCDVFVRDDGIELAVVVDVPGTC